MSGWLLNERVIVMTQNEKNLLLKDLCARLPYGVKCIVKSDGYVGVISSIESQYGVVTFDDGRQEEICDIKPYLFPLSSMTKEQKEEYNSVCNKDLDALSEAVCNRTYVKTRIAMPLYYGIDWLIANHFDYRGLIPKGLAIDCTNLNIY